MTSSINEIIFTYKSKVNQSFSKVKQWSVSLCADFNDTNRYQTALEKLKTVFKYELCTYVLWDIYNLGEILLESVKLNSSPQKTPLPICMWFPHGFKFSVIWGWQQLLSDWLCWLLSEGMAKCSRSQGSPEHSTGLISYSLPSLTDQAGNFW